MSSQNSNFYFLQCCLPPPGACVWLRGSKVDASAVCLWLLIIIINISVSLVIIGVVLLKSSSPFEYFYLLVLYPSRFVVLAVPKLLMILNTTHSFPDLTVVAEKKAVWGFQCSVCRVRFISKPNRFFLFIKNIFSAFIKLFYFDGFLTLRVWFFFSPLKYLTACFSLEW